MVPNRGSFEPVSDHPVQLSVQIIGSLRVRRGETDLDARQLGGPKPRQILEILLLQLGRPVSKDRLIELLWAGHPPAEALATLESYVSVLRRHLQPGAGKSGPLRTATGGYLLERSLVDLDLDHFDVLLHRAHRAAPDQAYLLLQQALALTGGPLLDDELLPAWAEDERELHATRVREARILAAETAMVLEKPAEAVDWANQALSTDPLNERAWTALILALEQAGRHTEGLQCYERYRRALDRELGCTPGPALRTAHVRLLRVTADGEDELSGVLSALLVLHHQLSQGQLGQDVTVMDSSRILDVDPIRESLHEAGKVINSFLRRALSAA